MTSYITGRTQQVLYNGKLSQLQSYGDPQGSVLGPLLFSLYTADISKVVEFHGHKVHQYAYDCQVYRSIPVSEAEAAANASSRCVGDLSAWLSAS